VLFRSLFPDNPQKGAPYIDGLMLLNDVETGKTLSIMDGSFITALRTGAVGGVGMRHFTAADCHSVGLIGAGKQGLFQVMYACEARDIHDVYIYDAMNVDYASFIKRLETVIKGKKPNFHICSSVEELLAKSEIVVCATTSPSPVVPDDADLLKGKHFIAIGSYKPEVRELPNAIWQLVDHVYTELPFACEESGDLSQPLADGLISLENVRYIGELLSNCAKPKLPQAGETTYFKSVGMGLLDLNIAHLMYNEALKRNLGQKVVF
jgi:ornithine cyclodeaminase/alanine dehydrogenase-like protein (mu-crystallin family)